ncbi:MAG: hypothetical protein H5U40_13075, partial [Polyangiaceae bacterium]|nr:hypothetical protein [Polyangiaceae bacterium]
MTLGLPARIRRVDRPVRGALALTLTKDGERFVLLACCRPEASGLAIVDERPRGLPADGFTSLLRRKLVGAAVVDVRGRGASTEIAIAAEEGPLRLTIEPGGLGGSVALLDGNGRILLSAGKARSEPG